MTVPNAPELVTQAFLRLRRSGFNLGIDEYLAALEVAADSNGFAPNEQGLKQALKLLWCDSKSEQNQFEPLWQDAVAAVARIAQAQRSELQKQDEVVQPSEATRDLPDVPPQTPVEEAEVTTEEQTTAEFAADLAAQPVRAPFTPAMVDSPTQLESYWPLSRRSMSYSWRYLRRPRLEGPRVVVDVEATIREAARQGYYLAPVLRQREYNRAQLLLLIDQKGSMEPFHRFSRDLVETATYDSSFHEDQVTVRYFQNAPVDTLYRTQFLTQPLAMTEVLETCGNNTSVLIVSDAGAARGYRQLQRIQKVTRFLMQFRRRTTLIAWLNPMPVKRWQGSSAEIIANLVPMFQMDDDGLGNAIDIVRGQPLQHLQSPLL